MASPASYQVLLLFTPTSTYDVTSDVEEISFDRSLGTFQQPLQVGQGTIRLHNVYGRYTPSNTDSDLAMRLGLEVQVTGVSSGTTATRLFTGTIDEIGIDIALDSPRASIWSLSDSAKVLTQRRFYTKTYSGTCVVSLWADAFASVGIPLAQQSIAAIADLRPHWISLGPADHAIDDANEFLQTGPYTVNIGRSGNVAVWDRFYHTSAAAVNTYTALWALDYTFKVDNVINLVNAKSNRISSPNSAELFDTSASTEEEDLAIINPSTHFYFEHGYFTNDFGGDDDDRHRCRTDAATRSDFEMNTEADGGGTDRTAQCSITSVYYGWTGCASVWNGSVNTCYMVDYGMYARAYGPDDELSWIQNNIASQSLYGVRKFELSSFMLGKLSVSKSMASYIVSQYATPAVEFGVTLRNEYPFALTEDVGSNISIVSSLAGINNKFTIMSSRTRLTAGPDGWVHENEYDLREASKV